jgi:hypothetical protein
MPKGKEKAAPEKRQFKDTATGQSVWATDYEEALQLLSKPTKEDKDERTR